MAFVDEVEIAVARAKRDVLRERALAGIIRPKKGSVVVKPIPVQTEAERVLTLHKMPYTQYLLTAHWKEIRQNALVYAGHKCQLCNSSQSLQVHHRTYERRGCERLSDLTVLCRSCHAKFHGKLAKEK